MKRFLLPCIAAILTPAMAFSQVIVDDSWADGDRANTGPLQADWWSSSSTSGNSVEVVTDSMGLVTGTSGRGLHGTFAPQTLGIGESLVTTFTFMTPATVGVSKGSGLRFTVADFNDPGLAADLSSSSSSVNPLYTNLPSYMVDFDVNTDATADTSIRELDNPNTIGRWAGTTTGWTQLGTGPDDGYSFLADTEYVVVVSLTRTGADSMDIFGSLSQGGSLLSSHMEPDSSGIVNHIGVVGVWVNSNVFGSNTTPGDPDNGIEFSNIKVELIVPEPSSAGLLLMGTLLMGRFLRRHTRG